MLPPEAIHEFKQLYKKRFDVELTDDEASLRANNLVNLYQAVFSADKPNITTCEQLFAERPG